MAHILLIVQEDFPANITGGHLSDFLQDITKTTYSGTGIEESTGWSQIRPRQMALYDFTIPEKALDRALTDLAPYVGGKLTKITKVFDIPVLGKAIQSLMLRSSQ